MTNTYDEMQTKMSELSVQMSDAADYAVAWGLATPQNKPTTYKGKGRPRKTDYTIWEHPFDGKLRKEINYSPAPHSQ